jgi:hypothetical protein
MFILVLVVSDVRVLALSGVELDAIHRDSVHHKFQDETACTASLTLPGNSNSAKAFNYFTSQGLQPHQAAGIVGNLTAESGVLPKRKQGEPVSYQATMEDIQEAIRLNKADSSKGFGVGIAQWTSWNRLQGLVDSAKDSNPLTLDAQLPFLLKELEAHGMAELKQAGDIQQATWIFLSFFERPASVTNAGMANNPTQPKGGTALAALVDRTKLAQNVLSGSANDTTTPDDQTDFCSDGVTGDESEPDFNRTFQVKYDGPPAGGFSESKCTGGFTQGAASLSELIMERYSPPVTSVGGYSCRQNTNDNSVSIHGVGRALDIMIDGTTPKGLETGTRIRNFVINNAEQLGVQVVIWDRHIWSVNEKGWRDYNGPNPHTDHLHVEINVAASKNAQLGQ